MTDLFRDAPAAATTAARAPSARTSLAGGLGRALAGLAAILAVGFSSGAARADAAADAAMRARNAVPALEDAIGRGMQMYGVPGAAVAVVAGGEVVYAKGFGVRAAGGAPVDTGTVFQIGSATKAFLATTLAQMVDEKKFEWDTRVIGLAPEFALHDPWVTREFRVYDLLAQRSGLRPYVHDGLAALGYDAGALIQSLRFAEPVTSFRSTFAYVNIPHLEAGRIVAAAAGKKEWSEVAAERIFTPLGMTSTSTTAEAIEAAANHAVGHRWTLDGVTAIPFDPSFPYALGPAGNINSNVDDMTHWLRTLLAGGIYDGKRIVGAGALAYTQVPKVAINEQQSYAMGWVIHETPNGRIVWHNGGTNGFGAHVGLVPHLGIGIVVLSNEENRGFPDGVAATFYQTLLGNPSFDVLAAGLEHARKSEEEARAKFVAPAAPRPARDLAVYAARYNTLGLGAAVVAVEDGRLVLRLAETGAALELTPFDGDVFTVRLRPEGSFARVVEAWGSEPMGFAQFQIDIDGRLADLRWSLGEDSFLFDRVEER